MKAIVKVSKSSSYAVYNGNTFEVKEVLSKLVALRFGDDELKLNRIVDFSFSEVLIVNIETELQKAYDNYNWGSDCSTYKHLQEYCIVNEINVKQPTFNCPA